MAGLTVGTGLVASLALGNGMKRDNVDKAYVGVVFLLSGGGSIARCRAEPARQDGKR